MFETEIGSDIYSGHQIHAETSRLLESAQLIFKPCLP
jgi:hypothetical protein